MPAIMKGWIDRVFAFGFAYGVGIHGGARWGDRYGEGTLIGRRAILSVTIDGGRCHSGRALLSAILLLMFLMYDGISSSIFRL